MEWTGARYADKPTAEVQVWIDAPPERVWDLVADIELMPSMSAELQSVEWLDGAVGPSLGARFLGHNRHESFGEWSSPAAIVEFDRCRSFAWAVGNPAYPSAVWRFRLTPENSGTRLIQWAQLGPGPSGLSFAIERTPEKEQKIVFVRLREFERNMTVTLNAIKELAEKGAP